VEYNELMSEVNAILTDYQREVLRLGEEYDNEDGDYEEMSPEELGKKITEVKAAKLKAIMKLLEGKQC